MSAPVLSDRRDPTLRPNIVVTGIGGAGCNAVNGMVLSVASNDGVTFISMNTDASSLSQSLASHKVQLGIECTRGLGAGSKPEVGNQAATESEEEIRRLLKDADLVFITSGMGGGTGTGASPVVARIAKEMGKLVIAVVTKPFLFEGKKRMTVACEGIEQLRKHVDAITIVSNERLLLFATEELTLVDAFRIADQVLQSAVCSVTKLVLDNGFINRDFADLRTMIESSGIAMIGHGDATGPNRHMVAVENAINNPVLEEGISIRYAKNVLINITGSRKDLGLLQVQSIIAKVREYIQEDANLIFGTVFDDSMTDAISVLIIATGMPEGENVDALEYSAIQQKSQKQTDAPVVDDLFHATSKTETPKQNAYVAPKPVEKDEQSELFNENDIISHTSDLIKFESIPESYEESRSAANIDLLQADAIRFTQPAQEIQSNSDIKKKTLNGGNDNVLPLFNSVFGRAYKKILSTGKTVMEERDVVMNSTNYTSTVSEWKRAVSVEESVNKDSWDIPAIARSA